MLGQCLLPQVWEAKNALKFQAFVIWKQLRGSCLKRICVSAVIIIFSQKNFDLHLFVQTSECFDFEENWPASLCWLVGSREASLSVPVNKPWKGLISSFLVFLCVREHHCSALIHFLEIAVLVGIRGANRSNWKAGQNFFFREDHQDSTTNYMKRISRSVWEKIGQNTGRLDFQLRRMEMVHDHQKARSSVHDPQKDRGAVPDCQMGSSYVFCDHRKS